jgi:cell division protein FtsI/penicillin-binding protein 2
MRRRLLAAVLVVGVAAAGGLSACSKDSGPDPTVRAFLDGWKNKNLEKVGFLAATGDAMPAADVLTQLKALSGDLLDKPLALTAQKATVTKDDATAPVAVEWTVSDGVVWKYQTTVRLHKKGDVWAVVWTPATMQSELQAGDHLGTKRLTAARASILDGGGDAIVKPRPVVDVGIEPRKVKDAAELSKTIDDALKSVDVDAGLADLPDRIKAARPDAWVDVVTLRREVYNKIRSKIHDLDGTVFREHNLMLSPTRSFARALLGQVGDVQKDDMDAHPGRYIVGDQIGQGGLQEQYDDQLRGTNGVAVVINGRVDGNGDQVETPELYRAAPVDGVPLKTTLVQKIQNAADAALAGQKKLRTSLVAVRVSDGAVVAVANGPEGGTENLAFTAQVPPGSTFKVVTALAGLDAGVVKEDTPLDCPKTVSVEGRVFKNSNNFSLGTVPFHQDFARSCNTAFINLGLKLTPEQLASAAAATGIGVDWKLGPPAFTGSLGPNASKVDLAAASFGQGDTLVSPLAMAGVAAAVAKGTWQAPKLFAAAPAGGPAAPASGSAAPSAPPAGPLNTASVAALRTMMREVVTDGTGTALANAQGAPVYAKTGTAEYDDNPAHTHRWIIGYQGDLAFAVLVEAGGDGGPAIPLAEAFLNNIN